MQASSWRDRPECTFCRMNTAVILMAKWRPKHALEHWSDGVFQGELRVTKHAMLIGCFMFPYRFWTASTTRMPSVPKAVDELGISSCSGAGLTAFVLQLDTGQWTCRSPGPTKAFEHLVGKYIKCKLNYALCFATTATSATSYQCVTSIRSSQCWRMPIEKGTVGLIACSLQVNVETKGTKSDLFFSLQLGKEKVWSYLADGRQFLAMQLTQFGARNNEAAAVDERFAVILQLFISKACHCYLPYATIAQVKMELLNL